MFTRKVGQMQITMFLYIEPCDLMDRTVCFEHLSIKRTILVDNDILSTKRAVLVDRGVRFVKR